MEEHEIQLLLSIEEENIHKIKTIYQNNPDIYIDTRFINTAAKIGNIDILKYLIKHCSRDCLDESLEVSIKYNNIECIKYLYVNNFRRAHIKDPTIEYCCLHGNLECLKYFFKNVIYEYKQNPLYIFNCLRKAVSSGHIFITEYIIERLNIDIKSTKEFQLLANDTGLSNSIECVKHFIDKYRWNSRLLEYASSIGFIECIKYVCENYPIYKTYYFNTFKIIKLACKNGNLECVKYSHNIHNKYNKHCKLWDETTSSLCCKNNNLQCLLYIVEHGCKLHKNAANDACKNGNIEMLNFVINKGCKVNNETIKQASNSIECLKYLYDKGYRWNKNIIMKACHNGNLEIVNYLINTGCIITKSSLTVALLNDNISCADLLINLKGKKIWDKHNLYNCICSFSLRGILYSINYPCNIDDIIDILLTEYMSVFYLSGHPDLLKDFIYSIDKDKYPRITEVIKIMKDYLINTIKHE